MGYIDDATLLVLTNEIELHIERHVQFKLQKVAATCRSLLFAIGGKIELNKCFWIQITWKWQRGEPVE